MQKQFSLMLHTSSPLGLLGIGGTTDRAKGDGWKMWTPQLPTPSHHSLDAFCYKPPPTPRFFQLCCKALCHTHRLPNLGF